MPVQASLQFPSLRFSQEFCLQFCLKLYYYIRSCGREVFEKCCLFCHSSAICSVSLRLLARDLERDLERDIRRFHCFLMQGVQKLLNAKNRILLRLHVCES